MGGSWMMMMMHKYNVIMMIIKKALYEYLLSKKAHSDNRIHSLQLNEIVKI